ncbi:PHD finger protein 21A-like [Liolophura sinensis]|uniref:PHD finger protein 21A-like n=1 Tax=Liolophura sinensis TaxID=3198878 RepID=UPI003158AC15
MKSDPQNAEFKKKLHQFQAEITSLSEKQKSIVQKLRRDLLVNQSQQIKQAPIVQTNAVPKVQPKPILPRSDVLPQPTNLSTKVVNTVPVSPSPQARQIVVPTRLVQPNGHINTTTKTTTTTCPQILTSSPAVQAGDKPSKVQLPPHVQVRQPAPTQYRSISPATGPRSRSPSVQVKSTSSPIRVPQYPLTKSTLLQSQKTVNSKDNGDKSSMPPPPTTPPVRKPSDSEPRELKRTMDKKQTSPAEKKKLEFMAALDLVTPETLKELQCKRTERKRRSTANPQFSYNFEPERKRVTNYLANTLPPGVKRPRGRPPKYGPSPNNSRPTTPDGLAGVSFKNGFPRNGLADGDVHDDFCAVCRRSGELLMCDTCSLVYHLNCLDPPLATIPSGMWSCPKCQLTGMKRPPPSPVNSGTLAIVHSYLTTKASKEDERKKLQKRSAELSNEKVQLENKSKQLNECLTKQIQHKQKLLADTKEATESMEKLKKFIQVFQSS